MSRSWKNLKQLDMSGVECEFLGGFSFNSPLPFIIEMYGVIRLWKVMVTVGKVKFIKAGLTFIIWWERRVCCV